MNPQVTGLNPNSGDWAGGYPVVITGTGFTGAVSVRFDNGDDLAFTVDSDTQITATIPVCPIGSISNGYHVMVTTAEGTSDYNAPPDLFGYLMAP